MAERLELATGLVHRTLAGGPAIQQMWPREAGVLATMAVPLAKAIKGSFLLDQLQRVGTGSPAVTRTRRTRRTSMPGARLSSEVSVCTDGKRGRSMVAMLGK